jgi:6-phosphogluconolactonase
MSLLLQFRTQNDACEMLAGTLAQNLRAAAAAHGEASMIASGGESPRPLYRLLSSIGLPWETVTVVPSDERWIDPDDPASNEGMLRAELLNGRAARARLVSLYRAGVTAARALAEIDSELARLKRPFDAVVIGMGADGHIASLFPDSPDIECALRSKAFVVAQTIRRLPQPRVSLTVPTLLDTDEVSLLFFGKDKRAAFERASEPGPAAEYPVRAILHQQRVRVTAYWAP